MAFINACAEPTAFLSSICSIVTPDSEAYGQSIKRWFEVVGKRSVCVASLHLILSWRVEVELYGELLITTKSMD